MLKTKLTTIAMIGTMLSAPIFLSACVSSGHTVRRRRAVVRAPRHHHRRPVVVRPRPIRHRR